MHFSTSECHAPAENVRGDKRTGLLATVMKVGKDDQEGLGSVRRLRRLHRQSHAGQRSREGLFMLEEGANPLQIDKVRYDFGFAMGPYQVATWPASMISTRAQGALEPASGA